MTHGELVRQAERWLYRHGCVLVVTEFSCNYSYEVPDALGWRSVGNSILMECKVSREDFKRDQLKQARMYEACSIGQERYYFTPEGLLSPGELPDGWGLLEWDGKRVHLKKQTRRRELSDYAGQTEIAILVSLFRRFNRQHLEGVSVKASIQRRPTKSRARVGIVAGVKSKVSGSKS